MPHIVQNYFHVLGSVELCDTHLRPALHILGMLSPNNIDMVQIDGAGGLLPPRIRQKQQVLAFIGIRVLWRLCQEVVYFFKGVCRELLILRGHQRVLQSWVVLVIYRPAVH